MRLTPRFFAIHLDAIRIQIRMRDTSFLPPGETTRPAGGKTKPQNTKIEGMTNG
jgi:hypothetical protein